MEGRGRGWGALLAVQCVAATPRPADARLARSALQWDASLRCATISDRA